MGNFFNNGSITMKLHIIKVLYGLESHAKDGRCGLSRNGDIRRYLGKLVEKQILVVVFSHCSSFLINGRLTPVLPREEVVTSLPYTFDND